MSDETVYTPEPMNNEQPGFLSERVYNALRFTALIMLPALGAAYFTLAEIWGLPKAQEVVGTIVVIDTFAGVLLRAARRSYEGSEARFDGTLVVERHPEGEAITNVALDSTAVAGKDEIVVKIDRV